MFTHQHSLRHLLRPEHYCSLAHHDAEQERLFRPAWHLVSTRSALPRDGDFITLHCCGRPVLVRNSGGQYFAYENICSHRHCLLSDATRGNQPTLRCQYHGWEYAEDGRTAKIPEAKCFRPWDRENSRLNRFRLETCGDLIFVCLDPETVSLREWLDPHFEEMRRNFDAPMWKMSLLWEYDCACNWKVPVENTLESYHLPALHRKTFGDFMPPERNSRHTLHDRFTSLDFESTLKSEFLQSRVSKWLGGSPTQQYFHRHIHPNLVMVMTDTFNHISTYWPTSPNSVRVRTRFFSLRGSRRGPLAGTVAWLAWRIARSRAIRILNEDRGIFVSQQTGLEKSHHPGVIGSREERIHAFQNYIVNRLGINVDCPTTRTNSTPTS